MFVTCFDTTMATLVALLVWRVRPYLVILPWATIAAMDGAFLSSALTKFPHGAWFTVTLAIVLASTSQRLTTVSAYDTSVLTILSTVLGIFILWRFGKESQWRAEAVDRHSLSTFVNKEEDGTPRLAGHNGGESLTVTKGLGIFFDKGGIKTPLVCMHIFPRSVTVVSC
jgi:KUP system potassium uptake protein